MLIVSVLRRLYAAQTLHSALFSFPFMFEHSLILPRGQAHRVWLLAYEHHLDRLFKGALSRASGEIILIY